MAYDNFEPGIVALYDDKKIDELLSNPGIVRNRRKIEASVNNVRRFLEIQKTFGSFDRYIWGFVNNKPVVNSWRNSSEVPATSPLSDAVSKDLKQRGFRFLGSVTVYAHLQATGIVDDHISTCFRKTK